MQEVPPNVFASDFPVSLQVDGDGGIPLKTGLKHVNPPDTESPASVVRCPLKMFEMHWL
jgi:hypothetical protein